MRYLIAVALLAAGSLLAAAQTPAALPLTLDEALERGLETSHRLAEAAARGEAAGAAAEGRHAAVLPQVSAQAGYLRTNHVEPFGVLLPNGQLRIIYPDIPDNYHTRLDLQWSVYTGGRLDALERAARAEALAADGDLDAARADLRLEITRGYWALVTASASLRVVEESVASLGAHLRDVRNQLDAGLVPPSDVLRVEAQESRQRMLGIQARAFRDVAQAELGRLAGLPPGTLIAPTSQLDPPETPSTLAIDALLESATRQRSDRGALVRRVAAAEERQGALSGARKPTVSVGGGFDYARPNPRIFPRHGSWQESWDAGINVRWSLFDGGRARADLAEASAGLRATQARLAEFDAVLAVEIRQRLSDVESALAAIAAADDAVRAATEARRVIGERFAAGVATSSDMLDAQVALLQAELDRTQAMASARVADARLARALGQ